MTDPKKLLTDARWVYCPDCRREVEAVRRTGKIGKHTVGTRTLGVNFGMPTQCEGVGKKPGTPPADADMGEDWAWQAAPAVYQPAEQPSVLDAARAYVAEARAVQGAVPEPFLWNGPASDGIGGGAPAERGRFTYLEVDGVDITDAVTGIRVNGDGEDEARAHEELRALGTSTADSTPEDAPHLSASALEALNSVNRELREDYVRGRAAFWAAEREHLARLTDASAEDEMTGHAGDLDAAEVPFADGGLPGVSAVQSDAALTALRDLGHEPLNLGTIGDTVPEELIPDFSVLIDPLAAGLARLREAIGDAARFTSEAMDHTQDDFALLDGDDRAPANEITSAVGEMLRDAVAEGHLPEGTRIVWNGAPIDVLRDGTEVRMSVADADFADNTTTIELSAFPGHAPPVHDWNDAPLIVRNDDGTAQALNADGSPWAGDMASLDTPPLPRRVPGASLPGGEE